MTPEPPPPAETSAAAPAAGGEATCEQAVTHLSDLMASDKSAGVPQGLVPQIRDVLDARCKTDTWTADVRTCFAAMKTMDDGEKCANAMSQAQQKAVQDDINKLADAAANQAGAPATGGAPPPAAPASAPPPPGGTRGPVNKSGDPCDGGN